MSVLSALGARIDAVHPVADRLDTLRNETTFATNSKKGISLAT
jgi:ubiquinone biosynthesis protein COQ9